jgi:hypothetical protein
MRYANIDKLEAELEREAYQHFHRYLKHVPIQELRARYLAIRRHSRLAEIAANADPNLRNLCLGDYRNPSFWIRKELLTVEEFRLRGEILPCDSIVPVGVPQIPRPDSLKGKKPAGEDFLVRYDKWEHLRPMLQRGAIRLKAASSYKQRENNEARLDDEVNKEDFMPGEYVKVTDLFGNDIPVIGDRRRGTSIGDFYVWCVSNDFDAALFKAFESDGCMVILDPKEFAFRLEKATRAVLPDWKFSHFNVEYYDPYELEAGQRPYPVMSKSLNFVYQKEYRFFWASGHGDRPQPFIDVQIGSLKDIAELVRCQST